ncbi:spore germination protein GerPC [Radiobacillus deserti]|uniref:spore germination protein GerPC n=1 Tax=Radiobacillus deserti TaxID=2594883 RepID=UPI001315309E|nr:spore germination protein GerPC [Radiobacillus deserti]
MYYYNWNDYLQQLHTYVGEQQRKIDDLEQRVLALENDKKQHTVVEKLEYNFDQLKIERLDGTLHIGLSPEELSSMDSTALQIPPRRNEPNSLEARDPILQQLHTYVNKELPNRIQQLSKEYQVPIDDNFEKEILTDIRTQLSGRLAYYRKEQTPEHSLYPVISQEIDHSLQQFFIRELEKGDSNNET